MPLTVNDVFKLTSLRGPVDGLTVEPSGDVSGSAVLSRLADVTVDWRAPSPAVTHAIASVPVMTAQELQSSPLQGLAQSLEAVPVLTLEALRKLTVEWSGAQRKLVDVAVSAQFQQAYLRMVDSWWALVVRQGPNNVRELHERLIRAAHLAVRVVRNAASLSDPEVIARLRKARVVVPQAWKRSYQKHKATLARNASALEGLTTPGSSGREALIRDAQERHQKLAERIRMRQAIQARAQGLYSKIKARAVNPPVATEGRAGFVLRTSAIVGPLSDAVSAPTPVEVTPSGISASLALDSQFYRTLGDSLSDAAKLELDSTLQLHGAQRPATLTDLFAALDYDLLVFEANDACSWIHVWETDEVETLPPADRPQSTTERPSVRAIGWGDLIVARERLIGYEAREIAHIESILSGEKKVREHERTRRTEDLVETETLQTTESQRDLQTSDRYELQSQSGSTISEDFKVDAGVNTSGRYGLTKVETSLDVGFGQSSSEAQSSSVRLAKDITSRAVERTFESVRKLRRTTITEQIRELNVHSIDNTPGQSITEMPPSKSGVYLWVEKLHEVELRQYGTRLMLEFHVPEPAISLLEQGKPKPLAVKKPAPLSIGPADISEANYLCLTKRYGVDDVRPPPPPFLQVGWAWASRPSESEDEDTSEDTVAELVKIPENYAPVSGRTVISAHPAEEQYVDVFAAVAGYPVINIAGTSFGEEDFDFDPKDTWPQGVPVSIRAHGHFDKTLTAQFTLRCQRTPEAFRVWQLRTYESIRQAHQVMVREYERAVERATIDSRTEVLFRIRSLPESELRSLEREELKKWSVKAMRHPHQFQFNAVELVGGHQEVSAQGADFQAPIVRFFEEAFEWREMSYFMYPYFWGRRDSWRLRREVEHPDPLHGRFLRAGAARVIVPVTPGYEARVLRYLDAEGQKELERITGVSNEEVPLDTEAEALWLELLIHKHEDQTIGSGTLSVQSGQRQVSINSDSSWKAARRDVGRELYIGANRYVIVRVADETHFELNEPYAGANDVEARYTSGSVAFGSPWTVRIPTGLVILQEDLARLESLG